MHLAFVSVPERGAADRLLSEFADRCLAGGARLAGVVQHNSDCPEQSGCDMDLQLLPSGDLIRISQSLGAGSRGCRLDTAALEMAVGRVGPLLEQGADLLMINKFGKHEAEGRGFRPLIGAALLQEVPVLLGVNATNRAAFLEFAGSFAEELAPRPEALDAWFARSRGAALAAG
ncbi:DUF2478 domain-containing protein [Pseudodonghicola flavimaris]|uniref:DUF2478 domain-containing protein n=1 Tax=Pseudodonghicola flavimaris TaxID=3050036 RepID=A0ABT7F6E6_9RHOB|nr:DUF2478 domain-containing protein [Pseudodonghicola flavimaris]MDK3019964.1 DUF2478 domain-containing protein [Pseudodonghicola flavimaris]